MLTEYVQAAMRRAEYERLADGSWFSRIPALQGLWAEGATLEECRAELLSALEDWIVFGLVNGQQVPAIDGLDLMAVKTA